jgi:hypothetical protein
VRRDVYGLRKFGLARTRPVEAIGSQWKFQMIEAE